MPEEPTDSLSPAPEGSTPEAPPLAVHARRKRRSSPSRKHRHRDLTPEEDNRLRQRQAIAKILPSILAVMGGLSWLAGIWNVDKYQHHIGLIRTGQAFLAIGGGTLAFFLLREWIPKIIAGRKERKIRQATGHDERNRRRSGRHRHRSSKPSGVRVK